MSEITLNSLPKTLDELKAMPQAALTVPEEVAALTVAALAPVSYTHLTLPTN